VVSYVIYKEGSGATNKPKQPVMLAQHYYKALSPALCSHNLSLPDAGQSPHQISSKTCEKRCFGCTEQGKRLHSDVGQA